MKTFDKVFNFLLPHSCEGSGVLCVLDKKWTRKVQILGCNTPIRNPVTGLTMKNTHFLHRQHLLPLTFCELKYLYFYSLLFDF